MKEQYPEEDRWSRLLGDTIRRLPARRAPSTLESRVLGELARRASQPWWHRSFGHWPAFARVGLVTACVALIAPTLLGATLLDAIPGTGLLLMFAVAALLYAFLFGLGAAAYRLLYLQPHNGG